MKRVCTAQEEGRVNNAAAAMQEQHEVERVLEELIPHPPLGVLVDSSLISLMEQKLIKDVRALPDTDVVYEFFKPVDYTEVTLYVPDHRGGLLHGTSYWEDICRWGKQVEEAWEPEYTQRINGFCVDILVKIQSMWVKEHPDFTSGIDREHMELVVRVPKEPFGISKEH